MLRKTSRLGGAKEKTTVQQAPDDAKRKRAGCKAVSRHAPDAYKQSLGLHPCRASGRKLLCATLRSHSVRVLKWHACLNSLCACKFCMSHEYQSTSTLHRCARFHSKAKRQHSRCCASCWHGQRNNVCKRNLAGKMHRSTAAGRRRRDGRYLAGRRGRRLASGRSKQHKDKSMHNK